MTQETIYDDVCEVTSVRNNMVVKGEILKFSPNKFISLTLQRKVKVTLVWNSKVNLYVGTMAGVEFTSSGPKQYTYRTHAGRPNS